MSVLLTTKSASVNNKTGQRARILRKTCDLFNPLNAAVFPVKSGKALEPDVVCTITSNFPERKWVPIKLLLI